MNGDCSVDTNFVIAFFAQDPAVVERFRDADSLFVPSIVLGELYFGAFKSSRAAANVARVVELATRSPVLSCDAETARIYGQIKDDLRRKGRPIPENDIWIAALALQYDLTLLSRDGHFREVDGLIVEAW